MTDGNNTQVSYSLERSIRYRLISVMLPLLVVLVLVIHQSIHLLVDEIIVDRLKQDSESLISSVVEKDDGWEVEQRYLPHVYQRVKSGHYYLLKWNDQLLRSRSLWDKQVDVADFRAGDTEDYLYYEISGEHWVIHNLEFKKGGQEFSLWVAEDISAIEQKQSFYEYALWIALVAFVVVFIFWQRRTLHAGFARLGPIQQAISSNQSTGDLNFPKEVPQEIKPLVDSIILLVERSGDQVARSRMSVGNLAHELKRPLQSLRVMSSELDDAEVKGSLLSACDQLQKRIDSELKRARISGSPMPGSLFSFEEELPHLERLLNQIHNRSLNFSTEIEQDRIPFDRDDMLELLGNLLDNAWKYADSQVLLKLKQQGEQWCFSIEDDGPGVDEAQIQQVKQRGIRVDEDGQRNGAGLGLSICQSITESYGGMIHYGGSNLGGLMVTLELYNKLIDS